MSGLWQHDVRCPRYLKGTNATNPDECTCGDTEAENERLRAALQDAAQSIHDERAYHSHHADFRECSTERCRKYADVLARGEEERYMSLEMHYGDEPLYFSDPPEWPFYDECVGLLVAERGQSKPDPDG